jgi:hypothetical protein
MQDPKQLRVVIREELRKVFPNQFNLDRKEFAALVGVSEGHISNLENIHKCPLVQPVRVGTKVLYPFNDVIDYLVNQQLKTLKNKRGAPTKASRFEAKGGAI